MPYHVGEVCCFEWLQLDGPLDKTCTCNWCVLLSFEAVGLTVPCPVLGRFGSGPMGWASWCGHARRASLIGHHHGECALDVLDGLGKGRVGRAEVVDGGVLWDGRICNVSQ